ncbi:MAG: GtrA family protein [Gallionellaceae bacterium]|nr:GtrA family protein [Gallionellaceae bacterium]
MIRLFDTESTRFVVAGGINTIFSYVLYLLLLPITAYVIAYSISFIAGVVSGYTLNTLLVFKQPWTLKKLFQYPLVYIAQYLVGIVLLSILVGYLNINERLAPLVNVVLLLPLTFILSKKIIKPGVKHETIRQ